MSSRSFFKSEARRRSFSGSASPSASRVSMISPVFGSVTLPWTMALRKAMVSPRAGAELRGATVSPS